MNFVAPNLSRYTNGKYAGKYADCREIATKKWKHPYIKNVSGLLVRLIGSNKFYSEKIPMKESDTNSRIEANFRR